MAVVIAPALVAAGVTGTILGVAAATVLAEVIVIAVGLGISLISSLLFKPAQPKPSDVQTIFKQAAAPRIRSYGRVKVGGVLMFANTKGGVLDRVIAMGSGEIDAVEEHWIDDHEITLSGNAVSSPSQYLGKCILEFRLGTDSPAPYAGLMAAFPDLWTSSHLGKGVPSAWMEMFQVKSEDMGNVWPQYASTLYRQVQRAAKVPSISGGALTAPEWSDNAARIILDYLIHPDGLGLDQSWILNAAAEWEAAIAICDEPIALAAGGTEPRYRISTTYNFAERPADVLSRMLQACDGMLYPTPSRGLALKVGKWVAPTVTVDDDAITAFSEFGRGRDILTTANTIRARFTSPDHDYLETDADPWIDEDDVAARGEYAIDIDMFAVPSHAQTRRLLKLAAARSNPRWVGKLQCNLRALPVMGERYITVVISELGIAETFEVLNVQLLIETTVLTGVIIDIASLSADAYDWTTVLRTGGDEGTPPVVPPLIVPDNTLPSPTGVDLEVAGNMVRVSWDAPPEDYINVEVRYKQTAALDWLAAPVADGATSVNIGPLAYSTEYEFQVRHRSGTSSRVSPWSSSYVLTTEAEPTGPAFTGPGVTVVSPASGATVTMAADERELYVDTGTLAALTIKLPAVGGTTALRTGSGNAVTTGSGNPVTVLVAAETGEDLVELCFAAPVTALSLQDANGLAVPDVPTAAGGPGAAIFLRWVDEVTSWVWWK